MPQPPRPTIDDVRAAAERIAPYVHRTPVHTCRSIDAMTRASLAFKCDNFQKCGAFKIRGATNAVFSLTDEEAARGVVTHSSGNHAAALSLAGSWRGIQVYVVMPSDAPAIKQAAVRSYGGQITFCEPTLAARQSTADQIIERTGATLIHPYDDHRIIAGQGTAALELLEDRPNLDVIVTPVGGGGLLSGTLIAAKALKPGIRVIAVEPARVDDAYRSMQSGRIEPNERIDTIADGLRTTLGEKTLPIIRELVDDIVLVDEHEIAAALRVVLERMKIVIEPSSAVPLAALLSGKLDLSGQRVGIHFGGGNVDLDKLPAILAT
ncbi:MAG: pyridoxal-phosphate dependent enzyme [Planctomycetota bacterium]|nr:MAG: pyridoxal-phosphate dependent enzyme [Planctomycetota bacterium]